MDNQDMAKDNQTGTGPRSATGERSAAPRILFWGMTGPFSREPLAALLAASLPICAVFLPAPHGSETNAPRPLAPPAADANELALPILNPFVAEPNTLHLAWDHHIPVYEVSGRAGPALVDLVASLQPDVACVACFPRRIPKTLLDLTPLGFLNVHPSLLPDYRGPAPLFWTLRDGVHRTGVTIHFMDATLDTGDIARQAPLELPDGISGPEADRLGGILGGQLLVETVQAVAAGTLARRPQPAGGHYNGRPTAADFVLHVQWPARRAFNFMRGTEEWGLPYPVDVQGLRLQLAKALDFAPDAVLGSPYVRVAQDVWVQFTPGVLHARMVGG